MIDDNTHDPPTPIGSGGNPNIIWKTYHCEL